MSRSTLLWILPVSLLATVWLALERSVKIHRTTEGGDVWVPASGFPLIYRYQSPDISVYTISFVLPLLLNWGFFMLLFWGLERVFVRTFPSWAVPREFTWLLRFLLWGAALYSTFGTVMDMLVGRASWLPDGRVIEGG